MAKRYIATGNGMEVPLDAKTVDNAIDEIVRGGRKFGGWQTFDMQDANTHEEIAVMIDIKDPEWLEAWGPSPAELALS